MYARGMSQRDIAATIEDIYGFEMSHEQISNITDCVLPRKSWASFTKQLKTVYGAINAESARQAFSEIQKEWFAYPGAIAVLQTNFKHVEQLFNYGSAVRKVMYTTNAIESVNSSFRKVTKKGTFPNDMAVYKIFYLRILELYKSGKTTESKIWLWCGINC